MLTFGIFSNSPGLYLSHKSKVYFRIKACKNPKFFSEAGITICTGQTRTISCRDGANMAVTNAFWGRISDKVCPSDDGDPVVDCAGSRDTLPLVRKKCEGKKECKLSARHRYIHLFIFFIFNHRRTLSDKTMSTEIIRTKFRQKDTSVKVLVRIISSLSDLFCV